jgi:hypothetical protein
MSEYVHKDFSYMAFLNTANILLSFGSAALSPTNPYLTSRTQTGFTTFGAPQILDLLARVSGEVLKAAWFQKWLAHRRVRPEGYAGYVDNQLNGRAEYPFHPSLFQSTALPLLQQRYGAYLLPQAFPEGCPTHPSYPAAHACIAGACITILKAFFNEQFTISNPVVANADGTATESYIGSPLTVGNELNKLASNIALGRDTAGVHWRSDGAAGIRLGEDVGIGVLRDTARTITESFEGFRITRFDGSVVVI